MRYSATEWEAPRLAAKTEKRATKSAKIQILLFSETEAANQNQKFPFHFLSAPPTPPAENLRKEGKFLVLYRDRRERTRRALAFSHLDFARNSFELCPTNTAKIENRNRKPKWGRHEVPTQMYSPQKILNLKGFATLRVAPRLPIQL